MNDILYPSGNNMGGLIDHLYVVKAADIDETALNALSVAASTVTGELSLNVSSAIPLVALKKFGKLYFTKGIGAKLSYPKAGERDGGMRDIMVEVSKPRLDETGDEIIDGILNGPLVIIARDAQGKLRLCGVNRREDNTLAIDFPMYLEGDDANSGGAGAEKAAHGLSFKCEAPHSPLFYTGAIDLDSGT